jgi:hypothetical protein
LPIWRDSSLPNGNTAREDAVVTRRHDALTIAHQNWCIQMS